MQRTKIWGSGVLNQVSLDLKAAFPQSKGFARANLYRMGRFYNFYAGQREIVAQLVRQIGVESVSFSTVSESNQKASTLLRAIPKVLFGAWVELG